MEAPCSLTRSHLFTSFLPPGPLFSLPFVPGIPGTVHNYSDTNYVLLGLLIEHIAGEGGKEPLASIYKRMVRRWRLLWSRIGSEGARWVLWAPPPLPASPPDRASLLSLFLRVLLGARFSTPWACPTPASTAASSP